MTTPIHLGDIRCGDRIRITRQCKDVASGYTQTTEGLVCGYDVREETSPHNHFISFKIGSFDKAAILLDPNRFTITELVLIEAAPKPINISTLRTIPLKSIVSFLSPAFHGIDFSGSSLISRTEREDGTWRFSFRNKKGFNYYLKESEIQYLILVKEHNPSC